MVVNSEIQKTENFNRPKVRDCINWLVIAAMLAALLNFRIVHIINELGLGYPIDTETRAYSMIAFIIAVFFFVTFLFQTKYLFVAKRGSKNALIATLIDIFGLTVYAITWYRLATEDNLDWGGIDVLVVGILIGTGIIVIGSLINLIGYFAESDKPQREIRVFVLSLIMIPALIIGLLTVRDSVYTQSAKNLLNSPPPKGFVMTKVGELPKGARGLLNLSKKGKYADSGAGTYSGTYCCFVSSDGNRNAYVIDDRSEDDKLFVDGKQVGVKGELYAGLGYTGDDPRNTFSFSPDSSSYAFKSRQKDGQVHLYLNGRNIKLEYGLRIDDFKWSPDSKKFAYVAKRETGRRPDFPRETIIVVDGKEIARGTETLEKTSFIFSSDSQHYAYFSRQKDPPAIAYGSTKTYHFLNIDGKEFKFDTELNSEERYSPDIVESLDGQLICIQFRTVRIGNIGKKVIDWTGKITSSDYDSVCPTSITIHRYDKRVTSVDGKHTAEVKTNHGIMSVSLDNKDSRWFDIVWRPTFTADGKYLQYGAVIGKDLYSVRQEVE